MLLVLLGVLVAVLVVRSGTFRLGPVGGPGAAGLIDSGAYQAVFLTNNNTFFGKLQQQGDDWFVLTDVFYLSVSEESGTQLIKRGSEPQGPREPMIIPAAQVLFIENLRADSDIVTAITRFKAGEIPIATPPPATPLRSVAPTASPSPTR